MSVREYVGARYVPLFMGEWNNTNTYEPLSIVQYQGNSYTSRQYVPNGIEITDARYWVETWNFNAQVEQYRNETLSLRSDFDILNDIVSTLLISSLNTIYINNELLEGYNKIIFDASCVLQETINFNNQIIVVDSDVYFNPINSDLVAIHAEHTYISGKGNIIGNNTIDNVEYPNGHTGIELRNASLMENLTIRNFPNKSVSLGSNCILRNCHISVDNISNVNAGVTASGTNTNMAVIENCLIEHCRIGITFNSSNNCKAINNNIKDFKEIGITCDGTVSESGDGAYNCFINNNYLITEDGATFTTPWPIGIYFGNGAHNNVVSNNIGFNIPRGFIRCYGTTYGNIIVNNYCEECGDIDSSAYQIRSTIGDTWNNNTALKCNNGASLYNSQNNIIEALYLIDCIKSGISLTNAQNNKIDNLYITEISENVEDFISIYCPTVETNIFTNCNFDFTKMSTQLTPGSNIIKKILNSLPIIEKCVIVETNTTAQTQINPGLENGKAPNIIEATAIGFPGSGANITPPIVLIGSTITASYLTVGLCDPTGARIVGKVHVVMKYDYQQALRDLSE